MFQKTVLPLVIASTTLIGNTAVAQGTAGFALEEVIVTARKREENLQDTPLPIAAFAPSSGQSASSQIYIRGIGQSDFTAVADPGVGMNSRMRAPAK